MDNGAAGAASGGGTGAPAAGTQGGSTGGSSGGTPAGGQTTPPTATTQAPAATAPASFDFATLGLPAEDLGYIQQKGFKTLADVIGSQRNAEKLIGVPAESVIKLPQGTEVTQAQLNDSVYKKLGMPATPADYKLAPPAGVTDRSFADAAASWFHEQGLNVKQAQALAAKYGEFGAQVQQQQATALAARQQTDTVALKGEWGNNYDANLAMVDRAAQAFGMDKPQLEALRTAMGPAAAMKFLHNIGQKIGVDDTFVNNGDRGGSFSGVSPEQAKEQINALKADKGFVEKYAKGDVDAKARMTRLQQIAYPGTMVV